MLLRAGPIPIHPQRKRLHNRPIIPTSQPAHEHDRRTGKMLHRRRLVDILRSQAVHGGVQFDFCGGCAAGPLLFECGTCGLCGGYGFIGGRES